MKNKKSNKWHFTLPNISVFHLFFFSSGQVSGNHNATFISSGQVMNFSGDVIVVYVSQSSLGSDEAGKEDAFGSPVQEEASEATTAFQGSLRSRGDSTSHTAVSNETLPVQEVMEEQALGKWRVLFVCDPLRYNDLWSLLSPTANQ